MKKTLLALLLMFLCVTMVMTSCGLFKQGEGEKVVEVVEDTPEVKADKATIINVISGTKLGDVFADIEDVALPEMEEIEAIYNDAIGSFEEMKAQVELSIPEVADITGVIANGGAYLYGNDELAAAIVMAGEQIFVISQSDLGYSINVTDIALPEISDDELNAKIDAYIAEYVAQIEHYVDIIDGITIPSLTSSLITKNGDWYMLNRDFTKNMIKSYVVGFATAEGETVDAEGLASIDEALAKLDIDLGFAVSGDKIRGVKVDLTVRGEREVYPENGVGEPKTEEIITNIGFEALLNAELTNLEKVAMSLKNDEASMLYAINADDDTIKVDFDYNVNDQVIDISATIGYDAEAQALKSIDASYVIKTVAQNVEFNVAVDFDAKTIGASFKATSGSGQNATASLAINLNNVTKANADVVVFDFDFYTDTHGTIDASLKNDAEGNGVISFKMATDGETEMEFNGAIDYDNATKIPAEDEFVFTIIENYEVYDDKAWEIYDAFMAYVESNVKKSGEYTIVYYDAELDVTIVTSVSVNGTYEYLYDENGDIIGEQFVVLNNLDPMSIYISEGNLQLDEYYDFDVTYVDGEYVFELSPLAAFYNDVLGAYVEYITGNNDANPYPAVIYYDEANDVTYKIEMNVNGSWEDVYDEDGNWVDRIFIPDLATSSVSAYVIENDNIPYNYDFTLTIVDGEYVFELSPLTVFSNDALKAYVAYLEGAENHVTTCPTVIYYDEANDVTCTLHIYVEGYWETIYDDDGNVAGETFISDLETSSVSTYVAEGQNIPYYYDFTLTIVDGEFVFVAK